MNVLEGSAALCCLVYSALLSDGVHVAERDEVTFSGIYWGPAVKPE